MRLFAKDFLRAFGVVGADHEATAFLIRRGGTISIGDIDVRLGEGLRDARQGAGLIVDLDDHDILFHHVKLFLFKEKRRFGGMVHDESNNGVVHRVVNGHGKNIDTRFGKNGASSRHDPGSVRKKNRKLFLDRH